MNKKEWDGTDLALLAHDYLNVVQGRMELHGADKATVRFGLLGNGTHPHYQIVNKSETVTYNGANHEFDQRTSEFADKNLSREYSFQEIDNILGSMPKNKARAKQLTYAYFAENRATLPSQIKLHNDEIVSLVMTGVAVKDAFDTIAKKL